MFTLKANEVRPLGPQLIVLIVSIVLIVLMGLKNITMGELERKFSEA